MDPKKTIHTHRTIMFSELDKVMCYSIDNDNYIEALENNITGKKSADGVKQTAKFLTKIYSFDISNPKFLAFKYFWKISDSYEKVMISFLFAINQDYLLAESINVISNTKLGIKTEVDFFEENIEKYYPNKYSKITRHSIGKNLASSWKQVGFISGKVKNIRTQPDITYNIVAFAFLLAFLDGDRGDFILKSKEVKTLFINESYVRELAIEASKRDLFQYQYGGNVTSISFSNLLHKLEIYDI